MFNQPIVGTRCCMDLSLDSHTVGEPVANLAAPSANPTSTDNITNNRYAEMITSAITALNEENGSTKRALAKYIESNFSNLPPNHSELLTHHLKRLRDNAQIVLVKHYYQLSRSAVAAPVSVNGTASDTAASEVTKKRPGRPPKAKSVQAAVPVFVGHLPVENNVVAGFPGEAQPQNEGTGTLGSLYVSVGAVGEPGSGTSGSKRGRGRPPKQSGVKRGDGSPPKSGGVVQTVVGRSRGRPRKKSASQVVGSGKPRGRPPKRSNVDAGAAGVVTAFGITLVTGKRRGRPSKADVAKKPRTTAVVEPAYPKKLSGKPVGRPRKNVSGAEGHTPDSHLLTAYLEIKGKLDYFQTTIKRTLIVLKPEFNSENAAAALQELETLAAMDASTPNVPPQS